MSKPLNTDINIDKIMQKIRQEVERRKNQRHVIDSGTQTFKSPLSDTSSKQYLNPLSLPCFSSTASFEFKESYKIEDFLVHHDEDFLHFGYKAILRREPDYSGFDNYLTRLRSGELDKTAILLRLRYSPEGRQRRVKVKGLLMKAPFYFLYTIPVIGYVAKLAAGILALPVIIKNIKTFEAYTNLKINQGNQKCDETNSILASCLNQLADQLSSLDKFKADMGQIQQINTRLDELSNLKSDTAAVDELKTRLEEINTLKLDLDALNQISAQVEALDSSKAARQELSDTEAAIRTELTAKAGIETAQSLQNQIEELKTGKVANEIFHGELVQVKGQISSHKHYIVDQQRRLSVLLEEARKRLPDPIEPKQIQNMLTEEDHLLNAMYVTFEDQFRGTRDDIKQKQSIYIPVIKETAAGTIERPVLDLGCGRGEWLELLKENKMTAKGVDSNRILTGQCDELGLDVIEADVLAYLRSLASNSIGAVTGFHIIEHLPLKAIISLFDESIRLLKSGGVAIFESPNPENLIVGACNFYFDPTHIKPLPPTMTSYLLESRGFSRVEIKRLHPYPENLHVHGSDKILSDRINEHLYCAQDFSIIGYKV